MLNSNTYAVINDFICNKTRALYYNYLENAEKLKKKHKEEKQNKLTRELKPIFDSPTKESISKYLKDHKREHFKQAEFECKDKDGKTLLMKAVEQNNYELTKYVLDAMPNYFLYRWIEKPLFLHYEQEIEIKPKSIDVASSTYETALDIAVKQNNPKITKLLLDNNAIVNLNIEGKKEKPFHIIYEAIKHNSTDVIEGVLKAGGIERLQKLDCLRYEYQAELFNISELIVNHCDTNTGKMLANYIVYKQDPIASFIKRHFGFQQNDKTILDLVFYSITSFNEKRPLQSINNNLDIIGHKEFFDKFLKLSPSYTNDLKITINTMDLFDRSLSDATQETINSSYHKSFMYCGLSRALKKDFDINHHKIINRYTQVAFATSLYLNDVLNAQQFAVSCDRLLDDFHKKDEIIDTLITMQKLDNLKIASAFIKYSPSSINNLITKKYQVNLNAVADILNTIEVPKKSTKNTYYDFKKELEAAKEKYQDKILLTTQKKSLETITKALLSSKESKILDEKLLILLHLNGSITSCEFMQLLKPHLLSVSDIIPKFILPALKNCVEWYDITTDLSDSNLKDAIKSWCRVLDIYINKYISINKSVITEFGIEDNTELSEQKNYLQDFVDSVDSGSISCYKTKGKNTYVEFVLGGLNAPKSASSYMLSTKNNPLPIINNTNDYEESNCSNLDISLSDIANNSETQYLLGNEDTSEV